MGENLEQLFIEHMYIAEIAGMNCVKKNSEFEYLEECTQSAMEGLWRACLKFDPSWNIKFKTYATTYCNGFARHGLRRFTRNERRNLERARLSVNHVSTSVVISQPGMSPIYVEDMLINEKSEINHFAIDLEMFAKEVKLTSRQIKIIELMKQDIPKYKIAEKLECIPQTITKEVNTIRNKLNEWNGGNYHEQRISKRPSED